MDIASFFAGCGGLDLGFEQAGFRVVWANESEPAVRDTYIRNHPHTTFLLKDICEIRPEDIPDCDGFIGGPPCQSWSIAGRQLGLEDKRGQLLLTYIDLIKAKRPKFFLIENVKGLLDKKFKEPFNNFLISLDAAGYNVQWQLLDAINYGIPQNRERIFIIGFIKDLKTTFKFPDATCTKPVTLSKAIGDITETPRKFLKENIVSANSLRINHDVYAGSYGPYYRKGNRRRPWDRASFTIHATGENAPLHPSSPKMVYLGHEHWAFQRGLESKYRRLSIRECARIQTFPDSFIFDCPDIKAQYRMIGNAVPPRLGYVLATSILAALSNTEVNSKTHTISPKNTLNACTLVGYYKNKVHHDLIMQNMLYYVRADGRNGSIFKEDCSIAPEYLLLHHNDNAEIYELDGDEPVLTDASFLKTLGFEPTGEKYLSFKLKSKKSKSVQELGGNVSRPNYKNRNYCPYFTTIDKVINSEI